MTGNRQKKLTLEERLERAARSQAASPEAALQLVRQLARTHSAMIFARPHDFQLMDGLIGETLSSLGDNAMQYGGFCRGFLMAMEPKKPFRPAIGTQTSNALVLLGLMLLDHARGKGRDKDVYHCTRMTLGQYVDALSTFFPGNNPVDRKFQKWRDSFLKSHDPAIPLAEALTDILRQYIAGWRVLQRLDHILWCMEDFARHQRNPEAKGEEHSDLYGHYYALACEHPEDVPDPGGEESLRLEVFLPNRDFSPQALEEIEAPSPEFRALLEENMDPERLAAALEEVDTAVNHLLIMWVMPYIRIWQMPPFGNVIAPWEKP